MLDGVAHFPGSLLRRAFDERLAVDAAEEAEPVAVALLEQAQIHADVGLDAVPAVDAGLDQRVEDVPDVAVGVLDEETAPLMRGRDLARNAGLDELPEACRPHEGTLVAGVVVGGHDRVARRRRTGR